MEFNAMTAKLSDQEENYGTLGEQLWQGLSDIFAFH